MKNVTNFEIAKVQPQAVALHLLDFLPISAWRWLQKCCLQKKRVFFLCLVSTLNEYFYKKKVTFRKT